MNCKNPSGEKNPEKGRFSDLGEQIRKSLYPKQTEGGETTKSGMWRINGISAPIQVSSAGDNLQRGTQQPWEDTPDLCSGSSSDRTVLFWANQPLWTLVLSSIKWISSPTLLICENDKLITVNSHIHSALLNSYCNPQHWARQLLRQGYSPWAPKSSSPKHNNWKMSSLMSSAKPRQCIKKQIHCFANKGLYSQSYGFSVVMYECESWTIKKAEHWRIDAFELWCWRRLLRVP